MSLLDHVFPAECAACGARGALGCAGCLAALAGGASLVWPRPSPPGLPPPWAVAAYSGACRDLLLAYKERGAVGLGGALAVPLAAALSAASAEATSGRVLVVPVPSARRAIRDRGDDVVLRLTRRAASIVRRAGIPARVAPVIAHRRTVVDSAGLSAHDRAANLSDAFVVRPRMRARLAGLEVVIADDLITTGATIAETARALSECGAVVIGAATVAATRRRGDTGLLGREANGATVGTQG
jgi:predicted amidophosphoribosyltransferase